MKTTARIGPSAGVALSAPGPEGGPCRVSAVARWLSLRGDDPDRLGPRGRAGGVGRPGEAVQEVRGDGAHARRREAAYDRLRAEGQEGAAAFHPDADALRRRVARAQGA